MIIISILYKSATRNSFNCFSYTLLYTSELCYLSFSTILPSSPSSNEQIWWDFKTMILTPLESELLKAASQLRNYETSLHPHQHLCSFHSNTCILSLLHLNLVWNLDEQAVNSTVLDPHAFWINCWTAHWLWDAPDILQRNLNHSAIKGTKSHFLAKSRRLGSFYGYCLAIPCYQGYFASPPNFHCFYSHFNSTFVSHYIQFSF